MWRCKQVADALAEHHYWQLPWLKRIGLRVHVALCVVCGRHHRQVLLMQEMADQFRAREDGGTIPGQRPLDDEARRRLKEALKRADGR